MKIKTMLFMLVTMLYSVCCYAEQIVIESIDAEDGYIRSDGLIQEFNVLRVGDDGYSRTFASIMSFDTSILTGIPITSARIQLTRTGYWSVWFENPNPNPDALGPTLDLCTAFNGNTALEQQDFDAAPDVTDCAVDLIVNSEPSEQIFIELNPAAIAAINTAGKTQFRINSGTGNDIDDDPPRQDADALDFFDGGNLSNSPLLVINPTGEEPIDIFDEIFSVENLQPDGQYYDVNVPDTLDLAERAKLVVSGLTNSMDPCDSYSPYGHGFYNVNPPYMTDSIGGGEHNWGKITEALNFMRRMSGSIENIDIEPQSWKGMLAHIDTVGCRAQRARAALALNALYQQTSTPLLKTLIESVKQGFYSITYQDDYAYYLDPDPHWPCGGSGQNYYFDQSQGHGPPIRALARWYDVNGDVNDLTLAAKISCFMTLPKFWEPTYEPKFFAGTEHAHFKGHVHSFAQVLMGLITYAQVSNDARLKEFVRDGYEYIRNSGIDRIGLFGEGCGVGDMTYLAVKLSNMGVGDYWEDVDQYVRNHLTELQILDANALQAIVDQMPAPQPTDPVETTDNVLQRNIGTFWDDGTHPTMVPVSNLMWVICGHGNIPTGMYYAWDSIVQYKDQTAQINLLLNRASPWLDIDSYLPYQGKVVIKNKTANELFVRIPRWVEKSTVTCKVNDEPVSTVWIARYISVKSLRSGDVITIEFDMVETTETYTLKWKHGEFWIESNMACDWWEPLAVPDQFTCHFKGNTLVDISPRKTGLGYQLYLRDHFNAAQAPIKTVRRFVSTYQYAQDDCIDRPKGDVDGDCRVTLIDFAKLSSEWLECGLVNQAGCQQ